jgi:outer membrane protein assembly factor BamE (lipoprotein component of BamABCDE complex)
MKLHYQKMGKLALTGVLFGVGVAWAAQSGYVVDPRQEPLIQPGMTKVEVQNLIGRPPRESTYAIATGSTWVYGVRGKPQIDFMSAENIVYEVDFDKDGKVVRAGERDLR